MKRLDGKPHRTAKVKRQEWLAELDKYIEDKDELNAKRRLAYKNKPKVAKSVNKKFTTLDELMACYTL